MTICVNTTSWDSIPNWAAIVEHDPTAASHSWPSKKLEQSSSHRGLERHGNVGVDYHLRIVVGYEFHSRLRVCSYYKGSSNLPFNKSKTNLLLFFVIEMVWGDWLKKSLLQSNPITSSNTSSPTTSRLGWVRLMDAAMARKSSKMLQKYQAFTGSNIVSWTVLLDHIGDFVSWIHLSMSCVLKY